MPSAVTTALALIDPVAVDLLTPPMQRTSALPKMPADAKTALFAIAVNVPTPTI
jgi:hypothetical protein